jgi:nucleoid-associated protein YgaU
VAKESRKPGVKFPTTVKIKSSDTLQSLAHEFYGRYEFWRDIRDDNGISKKFGQNTRLVTLPKYKVGSKIKLPKIKVK